jgi:excisionase family DNA binding protein
MRRVALQLDPFPLLNRVILLNDKASISKLLVPHDLTSAKYGARPLLDIQTAAEKLCCSERFVRRLVQERRIPFIKLGGTRVRFSDSDLDHWIAGQRVETKRERR